MTFDDLNKKVIRVFGRIIIQTTANQLFWCDRKDKMYMTKLVDLPTSNKSKCFVLEGDGYLLYSDDVQEFESERVGNFEKFNFKQNGVL